MGGMIHFLEMLRTPVGAVVGLVVVVMFIFYIRWLLAEPEEEE